jgi:hypothetical protein
LPDTLANSFRMAPLSIGAERDPRIGVQKEPLGW